MQRLMNETSYYSSRAQSYAQLARQAKDMKLKQALDALSRQFALKAVTGDPDRKVVVIDGVAASPSEIGPDRLTLGDASRE
jgi:hypothetical protein